MESDGRGVNAVGAPLTSPEVRRFKTTFLLLCQTRSHGFALTGIDVPGRESDHPTARSGLTEHYSTRAITALTPCEGVETREYAKKSGQTYEQSSEGGQVIRRERAGYDAPAEHQAGA